LHGNRGPRVLSAHTVVEGSRSSQQHSLPASALAVRSPLLHLRKCGCQTIVQRGVPVYTPRLGIWGFLFGDVAVLSVGAFDSVAGGCSELWVLRVGVLIELLLEGSTGGDVEGWVFNSVGGCGVDVALVVTDEALGTDFRTANDR
jgi:hypothetical protein